MKKILLTLLIPILVLVGCTSQPSSTPNQTGDNTTRVITDMMGRQVEIPNKIDSIICTGSGALRLISYMQATDLLVGIEDIDKTSEIKRAYNYIYHDQFKNLPSIGKGGGRGYTAYEEQIISLKPDIIFTYYNSDALEQLANKTGIPVVSIATEPNLFQDDMPKALNLIGDILDKKERSTELITYLDQLKTDLNDRTKDIAEADKPRVYTGAVTYSGAHGFTGTYGNFGPLVAINAINVADETGQKDGFDVDWEKIQVWDPDYIFLDPGNMDLVNEEYAKKPDYFNSLRAVQEGNVYSMISFNNYSTNFEVAIADAYYAGKVLYPEKFADIEIEAKIDEIMTKFLGKGIYSEMKEAGLSFGEIIIGQ